MGGLAEIDLAARAASRAISSGVPSTNSAPLTSTEMRLANWKTRSMSCSISSTVTSAGRAATMSRMTCRSSSGTPAAGSSSSSTRGRLATATAISSSRCLP